VGSLDGRVAIITGAGTGLGREHALCFAAEGAKVVVNDLGTVTGDDGVERARSQPVVDEIVAAGGEAVANTDSVADWEGAKRLVDQAVDAFGDLHVVVNNAGIVRDRVIVNMTEEEWDLVVDVHLKGHMATIRHAGAYWRGRSKAGDDIDRSVINTTSTSGLYGATGQANYGAAKSAIATLTQIAAGELGRYGVRCNAIAPSGRTAMTMATPVADRIAPPDDGSFDFWDPANVSPFLAYLASPACAFTGETFHVGGGQITRIQSWTAAEMIRRDARWTVEELVAAAPELAGQPVVRPALPL
jgi:NAD(P)-dependent dehydrogenase (short-subunit alcohol dehydrogenase family)